MQRTNERDLEIVRHLRKNARQTLSSLSRNTGIPVSTVYDRIGSLENDLIKKHVSIVDFDKAGYGIRLKALLRGEDRRMIEELVINCSHVNSAYRINGEWDFFVDLVFKDMKRMNSFIEDLSKVCDLKIFHVIDEIKVEDFEMTDE